jgi:site-specific DNA-methyltransferase (cytosine-N4-specific)
MDIPLRIPRDFSPDESTVISGDCAQSLRLLPREFFQTIVTSPPYWGFRDYGNPGQIGTEATFDTYIARLVAVFAEARSTLRRDGTLWINLGDGYTSGNRKYRARDNRYPSRQSHTRPLTPTGLKPKDLLGLPWRLALALQEDGWYLRADVVWEKSNALPESVKDRPSRTHEYVFLLSKEERYKYNSTAAREPGSGVATRNLRSVWRIPTRPIDANHHATFPVELASRCILASTEANDFVLDPFFGIGTTGTAALANSRRFLGIELNPTYVASFRARVQDQFRSINYSAL